MRVNLNVETGPAIEPMIDKVDALGVSLGLLEGRFDRPGR